MKKIFAIAMLGLILFNLGGYTLLFQYLINRTDSSIHEKINQNEFKMKDLVDVRIPVNFKTIENEDEYAAVSGQVKLKDTVYNFAYLKVTKDTMYLLCLPNHEKARLKNAKIIYSQQVSDFSVNEKSHTPVMKLSTFEGDHHYLTIEFNKVIAEEKAKTLPDYSFLSIVKAAVGVPGQPPDLSFLA